MNQIGWLAIRRRDARLRCLRPRCTFSEVILRKFPVYDIPELEFFELRCTYCHTPLVDKFLSNDAPKFFCNDSSHNIFEFFDVVLKLLSENGIRL